jgi:hypothetical protein
MAIRGIKPKQKGFVDRVKDDYTKRREMVQTSTDAYKSGEQNLARTGLQILGKGGAGFILDTIGEAGVSGFRALPDKIENPLRKVGGAVGEAIQPIIEPVLEAYGEFENKNPAFARDVDAVANIFSLAAPVKKPPVKISGTMIGRAGKKLDKIGGKQISNRKRDFVNDLISPKPTPSVKEDLVSRTTEKGILRSKVVEQTPREIEIAGQISKVPGLSKNRSLQHNYNVVKKEAMKKANMLKSTLSRSDIPFEESAYKEAIGESVKRIASNPVLVGDAEKTASKLIDEFYKIVDEAPKTASGLLEARKKFDSAVKAYKPKAFDPSSENAFSVVVRELRNTTNDFLDQIAPNASVKKSLREQSNLFTALDNIEGKAAGEANNAFTRLTQKLQNSVPLKGEIAGIAALGGLGATGIMAPKVVLTGAGLYAGGKLLSSGETKKIIGSLLKNADKAITVAKNRNIVRELRADRAIMLEFAKSLEGRDDK